MKLDDFVIPTDLAEARKSLKDLGDAGVLMAGGTSMVFVKGKGGGTAIDITRLGLDQIVVEPEGFTIGATTRIAQLQEFQANGWVLARVARLFSTQHIRNMSTVGGNIASIFPWNDLPVALLVLDCEVTVSGDTETVIPGTEFFSSQPRRYFKDGAILTSLKVKRLPVGTAFGYRKEVRTYADFSFATAAATVDLDGKRIKRVRASVGGAIPFPKRLTKVEEILTGRAVTKGGLGETAFLKLVQEGTKDIKWKGRGDVSDEYAGTLAAVTIRDAIADAASRALRDWEGHKNG